MRIKGVGIIGLGRYLVLLVVGVDIVKNEIIVYVKAVIFFVFDVRIIIEIGG